MKKEYMKPMIVFEDFSVDTNIAGTCESIVGNPTKGTCAVIGTGDIYMFHDTISQCDFTPAGEGDALGMYNGFCYHVPTEYNNLFNS